MFKTPLRYPGGKSRLSKQIHPLFPDSFREYREPFAGGCSLLLKVADSDKDGRIVKWINDIYHPLYSFLKVCSENPDQMIRTIRYIKDSFSDGKMLHEAMREFLETEENLEILGALFFVLNRITFSGTVMSGGYSESAYKGRFTDSSIDRIWQFSDALQGVKVTEYDYSDLLRADGDNVFIYCDPPYYSAKKSALYGYNGNLHKGFNHDRLFSELSECKHKWCLSYDDCEYIRDKYKDYNIIEIDATYGMKNVSPDKNGNKGNKELIITNY